MIYSYRSYGVSIEKYMLWSEYRGIDQLVLKRAFIRTYNNMGIRTDDRSNKTIIFDQRICEYVGFTEIMIFDQAYVTDHNCN